MAISDPSKLTRQMDEPPPMVTGETVGFGPRGRAPRIDTPKIGRFSVLDRLGEGGMGVVYAGFDQDLDRRLAIKVLNVEARGAGRTRIVREAQAMAKLSHPNVVHVYETGEHEGHVYVAMEYVKGQTLDEWLGAETRTLEERLRMVLAAGEGLLAAHEAGIIHRDFKPENVLVGVDGRARVLDFGLARAFEGADQALTSTLDEQLPEREGSALSTRLTNHGSIMGTPIYMSPEQHHGLPTDTASDQFNFCVVLYEALYGERPFNGDNRLALARSTREGKIRPAPAGSLVSTKLRETIVRGLAPEPGDRWPSMRVLLDELRRAGFPRDRRQLYLTGGLAAIGVALAVVFGLLFAFSGPTPEQLGEVERIAEAARVAGSRAHWVYPSEQQPEDTALRHVGTLRALTGELDEEGERRAEALSGEFAATLTRLGDQYWEAPGGKVFARDFYAQALLFDPTLEQVRERSGYLPAELADFRDRARSGAFSEQEIEAATQLNELAQPYADPAADAPSTDELVRKVERAHARSASRRGRSMQMEPVAPGPTPDVVPEPVEPSPTLEPEALEPEALEPETFESQSKVVAEGPSREERRAEAKQLVKEARKLEKAGKRSAALDRLFRATKVDRRYAPAWDVLRDIHFQNGAYQEAAGYGEKAVAFASRNGRYHLRLGEAYFKIHDFEGAKRAWTEAERLGIEQATRRLDALSRQQGR